MSEEGFSFEDTPNTSIRDAQILADLRTLNTHLQMRTTFAGEAGLTFGGSRDLYRALGYKRVLLPRDFRARYTRNAVAGRIVEAMPKACWRSGGELIEDEDPTNITEFEQAWLDLNTRLRIWYILQRADILAGIGRYAIVVLGAPGELNEPIEKLKPEELMYLSPFSEEDAMITRFETDTSNPRFGLPLEYSLRRTIVTNTMIQPPTLMPGRMIHWSRVLHIADGLLDDHVFGFPRLERVWNLLDDLEKVTGGGAEAFWKRADAGMQLKLDPMIKADPTDLEKVKEQIAEYTDGLRRVLTTRGVDINPLSSNVANFESPADAILKQISAGAAIPQRILVGSERGELASSQDADAWSERVSDRRNDWAGPNVIRPLVDRLICWGVLPKPKSYEVRWPEIRNLNEATRAIVAQDWAKINQAYGAVVITASEIRDKILGLRVLDLDGVSPDGSIPMAAPATPAETPEGSALLDEAPLDDGTLTLEDQAIAAEDARIAAEDAAAEIPTGTTKPALTNATQTRKDHPNAARPSSDTTRASMPRAAASAVDPALLQALRDAITAIEASNRRPIIVNSPIHVEIPSTRTTTHKNIVRTATGFEIEEVQS
jgi:hypothetical protein